MTFVTCLKLSTYNIHCFVTIKEENSNWLYEKK